MNISFRSTTPEDKEFLYRVYAGSRDYEMALVDWNEEQKQEFLRQQFEAQYKYYADTFIDAEFNLVLLFIDAEVFYFDSLSTGPGCP